jgi:purine-binding chemotaxis protein CheW
MGQAGQLVAPAPAGPPVPAPGTGACLVFRAGGLLAALSLEDVAETMRPRPVRPLAGTAPYVRGLAILRGRPAPVVDVARLLAGTDASATRFVAVRTGRGLVALATGQVLGVRRGLADESLADLADGEAVQRNTALLGPAPGRLVTAIGTLDGEPLFLLRSLGMVPDEVWAAVQGEEPTGDGGGDP